MPRSAPKTLAAHPAPEMLFEVGWEVCQQLGGIYTVLRSKAAWMVERWGERFCLLGPYDAKLSPAEFAPEEFADELGQVVGLLRESGIAALSGRWLCKGRPRVILFDLASAAPGLGEYRYFYWKFHDIALPDRPIVNQVLAFGHLVELFLKEYTRLFPARPVLAHFHEWMAASAIPELRRKHVAARILFTTHATLLGRYIATNDADYHEHLPRLHWLDEARRYDIECEVRLERAAAHGAHLLSTVSEVTVPESRYLLGREPDLLLPNGLNIERFVALHEFQNLHRTYKERINQFVLGHFFPSYTFDLDKTLYFFTSGRYEYRNKGFDLVLEALARLNWRMKTERVDRTVVFFLITRRPNRGLLSDALARRALMDGMLQTVEEIKTNLGQNLFMAVTAGHLPSGWESLVDDFWKLRLRQFIHAWRTERLPGIVTHHVEHEGHDEVLNFLRVSGLHNQVDNPVKVIYHPDFISSVSPLFGMDYDQFVRGCHLGVFPSLYEPWGYTPVECIARGVPAFTSDLAGFGSYVLKNLPEGGQPGVRVIHRRQTDFQRSADELAEAMFAFLTQERRERIKQRNATEALADSFDWSRMGVHYEAAHRLLAKVNPEV